MATLSSLLPVSNVLTANRTAVVTNKDFTAASNTLPASRAGNNTFVASGTIGNGATVALNSDGTVSVVAGVPESVGTAVVFESVNSFYISATYDSNAQKVVIAYTDSGNSSYGTSVVFQNEGTNAPSYIGLSTQTVTDTDPVDVTIIGGVNEDITGLTAASLYYVADNGDLTTIVTDTYAGRALASTKLLVRG